MTFGTGTLTIGSTGDGVTELQQWLIDRWFLIELPAPTGTFDDATYHAARAFQFSAGIGVDGQVGDGTRRAAEAFTGTALSTGWHPRAIRNVQGASDGGSYTTTSRRGLLHTTEGSRLPTYEGTQPHFTIGHNGAGSPVQLWQHLPITAAARALRNESGGSQTNRHGVIQIEIIGSAATMPTLATSDPELFRQLGEWMRWVEATAGVANVANHAFDGESAYGISGTTRLTQTEWEASTGWVGHQHIPENTHWDPGQIDIAALLLVPALATGGTAGGVGAGAAPMSVQLRTTARQLAASPTAPHIRATTRRLTNAFPSTTFAIATNGHPFFEVMLTTDRTLFDPGQASRRTEHNFYRSSVEGLRASDTAQGRYVGPIGATQRFAEANPNGAQIYYAIVAYDDEAGTRAHHGAAPLELARTAPAITMAPGFRGHTVTETLGVPLSMIRRSARQFATVGGPASRSYGAPPPAEPPATPAGQPANYVEDRVEGEDGYDVPRSPNPERPDPQIDAQPPPLAAPPTPPATATPPPVAVTPVAGEPVADAPAPVPAIVDAPPPPIAVDPAIAASYDDGFGNDAAQAWSGSSALTSTFPPGHGEPRALYDAESPYVGPDDEFDDLGWHGTTYGASDKDDSAEDAAAAPPVAPPPSSAPGWRMLAPQLAAERKRDVIESYVGEDRELYAAANPDGEFSGAAGTDHPAYQRYHLGLSFGITAFSQDSGALGQLLVLMRQRDQAHFDQTFGAEAATLVQVLTSPGPLSKDVDGGRSARVQPIAGVDIWEEPWLSRFGEAGRHRAFQGAQIELAAGMYLDPVAQFATDIGLATERGLAIILDRAAHRGVTGGQNWVIETVGPIQTPVLLRDALTGLGFADVESFQRTQPDLLVDDQFGPLTHAALTAALRASGATSPPILSYEQMIEAMVERATGQPWGDRIVRLSRAEISDLALQPELAQ